MDQVIENRSVPFKKHPNLYELTMNDDGWGEIILPRKPEKDKPVVIIIGKDPYYEDKKSILQTPGGGSSNVMVMSGRDGDEVRGAALAATADMVVKLPGAANKETVSRQELSVTLYDNGEVVVGNLSSSHEVIANGVELKRRDAGAEVSSRLYGADELSGMEVDFGGVNYVFSRSNNGNFEVFERGHDLKL